MHSDPLIFINKHEYSIQLQKIKNFAVFMKYSQIFNQI